MIPSTNRQFYLAPMQGHTDYIYRKIFAQSIGNIDKYFAPYIALENDKSIRKSRIREILPENIQEIKVVPQILAGKIDEMLALVKVVKDFGHTHVNLNLGCPFPMVVKRGKGCALLQHPEKVRELLDVLCKQDLKVSVKTRTGLLQHDEFLKIIPVLNSFPLEEVILHPRLGEQQYKGTADVSKFLQYKEQLVHPVVYNGDVNIENFESLFSNELKDISSVMIGRGILRDPLLILKIKGIPIEDEKASMKSFIWSLVEEYIKIFQHEPHVLSKVQEHFEYLGDWFPAELKVKKKVKKAKSLVEVKEALRLFF